jgi:plasmid replication initiation protein
VTVEQTGIQRFYQGDFFSALIQDLKLKTIHRFSTHNLFSLSKKPRQEPIRHSVTDGTSKLTITVRNDHGSGIATVFDQDLMLFLVSVLVREQDETGNISNRPTFAPADFFHFKGIKRSGGKDHKQLYDALVRLQNTFVEFSADDNVRRKISFNWISYLDAVSNKDKTKILRYTVEVPSAIVNAIAAKQFLTIDHSYFSLTSPLSRFLYLFARKAVGRKREWKESIQSLYAKS